MENKPFTTSALKYVKEHLACKNYTTIEQSILQVRLFKAGENIVKEATDCSALVFLLSGEIELSTGSVLGQKIEGPSMFFIAASERFCAKIKQDTTLVRCRLDLQTALCNRFAIEHLSQLKPNRNAKVEKNRISVFPIHSLLHTELKTVIEAIKLGLMCVHYHRIKRDALLICLRGFYSKGQLADLFAPILGVESEFKEKVINYYSDVETVKELMTALNMSPTTFKRKFHQAFGTTAKQWLIEKKKERVFRDLIMSHTPIAELADKYKFSENYMTTFCKEHFGKTPTQIRTDWSNYTHY